MPTQSSGDDPVLAQWVDAVKAQLEAGQPIDLEMYVREDPVRAERLRRLSADHRDDGRPGTITRPGPVTAIRPGTGLDTRSWLARRLPHRPGDRPRRHGRRLSRPSRSRFGDGSL